MSAQSCEVLHSYLSDPKSYTQTSSYRKGVRDGNIEIISVVLETISGILKESSSDNYQIRLNGLRFLKECMEANSRAFVFNVENSLLEILKESIFLKKRRSFLCRKLTEQEEKLKLSFRVLALECIKVWSHWHPHERVAPSRGNSQNQIGQEKSPSNFKKIYESLKKQGIEFPERLHFFRDIDLYKHNVNRRGSYLAMRINHHLRDLEDLQDSTNISEIYFDIDYLIRHSSDFASDQVSENIYLELTRLLPVAKQVFIPLKQYKDKLIDRQTLQNLLKEIFISDLAQSNQNDHNIFGMSSKISSSSSNSNGENTNDSRRSSGDNLKCSFDFDFKCQNAVESMNKRDSIGMPVRVSSISIEPTNSVITNTEINLMHQSSLKQGNLLNNNQNLRINRLGSSESQKTEKNCDETQISSFSSVLSTNLDKENGQTVQFSSRDFLRGEIVSKKSSQMSAVSFKNTNKDDYKLACLKQNHCIFENEAVKVTTSSRQNEGDSCEQLCIELSISVEAKSQHIRFIQTDYFQTIQNSTPIPLENNIIRNSDSSNFKKTQINQIQNNNIQRNPLLIKKDVLNLSGQYLNANQDLHISLKISYTDSNNAKKSFDVPLPVSILNSITYENFEDSTEIEESINSWSAPESTKYILKTPLFTVNPSIVSSENNLLSYFPSLKRIQSSSKHFREYFGMAKFIVPNSQSNSYESVNLKITHVNNKYMCAQIKPVIIDSTQNSQFPMELFLSTIQEIFSATSSSRQSQE